MCSFGGGIAWSSALDCFTSKIARIEECRGKKLKKNTKEQIIKKSMQTQISTRMDKSRKLHHHEVSGAEVEVGSNDVSNLSLERESVLRFISSPSSSSSDGA